MQTPEAFRDVFDVVDGPVSGDCIADVRGDMGRHLPVSTAAQEAGEVPLEAVSVNGDDVFAVVEERGEPLRLSGVDLRRWDVVPATTRLDHPVEGRVGASSRLGGDLLGHPFEVSSVKRAEPDRSPKIEYLHDARLGQQLGERDRRLVDVLHEHKGARKPTRSASCGDPIRPAEPGDRRCPCSLAVP